MTRLGTIAAALAGAATVGVLWLGACAEGDKTNGGQDGGGGTADLAGVRWRCTGGANLDCGGACRKLATNTFASCAPAGISTDETTCVMACDAARNQQGAGGFPCLQQARDCAELVACQSTCGEAPPTGTDGGTAKACEPAAATCGTNKSCDAQTKTCEADQPCTKNDDCVVMEGGFPVYGYRCVNRASDGAMVCRRNCSDGAGGVANSACALGWDCNASNFRCEPPPP